MEEEEENFDIDWLNERYPFDVEARNKELEAKVFAYLKEKDSLVLVDVGAGTGSNCLYFVEQLPQSQKWYLVEQNEKYASATIRRLKEYANFHKYEFEKKENSVKITSLAKTVEVVFINDTILNLEKLVDLSTVDLLMANAVFDSFSKEQFEQFSTIIIKKQLPFYTTLDYDNMFFSPEDPFDAVFIDKYNDYKERLQLNGIAMGKKTGTVILDTFEKEKWLVHCKSSIWRIEPDDIKMHYYLLNFMDNALEEMNMEEGMKSNFQRWLQRKKDLVITRRQQLKVQHSDIFAIPSDSQ